MFDISNYKNDLFQLVKQEIEIQPKSLLKQLSKNKIFEFEGKSNINEFPLKIKKTLEKIAEIKVGQELLMFFIRSSKKTLILQLSDEKSCFYREENMIMLEPNIFTLWKNTNESEWACMPFKVTFVHELLHFMHSLEDIDKFREMVYPLEPQDLLSHQMDNAEEQLTICGIDAFEKRAEIALCENHFRCAWNLPLRFTHHGVKSAKSAIQNNISIKPEQFVDLFERYHGKLPESSFRKQALIINIAEPNHHQQELIEAIERFVKVYNLAFINDPEEVLTLKTYELFDTNKFN